MVAPVSMNSEFTSPLTCQKVMSMALAVEGVVLNFFVAGEPLRPYFNRLLFSASK
jgi:hypothetical protein